MKLAETTAKRWAGLLTQDAVSKQASDEKKGDLATRIALVDSAKANVGRLLALKSFARIVAPFDGVVTARKTDIGALVNAGAGATPSTELFDVAKVDQLRLYVQVPQSYSARIKTGMTASFTVPEFPNRSFTGVLKTTSNAVSGSSGTLLAELAVNNPLNILHAGDYAQVTFNLPAAEASESVLRLPSSALLFRKAGMEVAAVDAQSRVHLEKITIGRDLGQVVEVGTGLNPSDRVIDNPPDSITNGQVVRVMEPKAPQSGVGTDAAD